MCNVTKRHGLLPSTRKNGSKAHQPLSKHPPPKHPVPMTPSKKWRNSTTWTTEHSQCCPSLFRVFLHSDGMWYLFMSVVKSMLACSLILTASMSHLPLKWKKCHLSTCLWKSWKKFGSTIVCICLLYEYKGAERFHSCLAVTVCHVIPENVNDIVKSLEANYPLPSPDWLLEEVASNSTRFSPRPPTLFVYK